MTALAKEKWLLALTKKLLFFVLHCIKPLDPVR